MENLLVNSEKYCFSSQIQFFVHLQTHYSKPGPVKAKGKEIFLIKIPELLLKKSYSKYLNFDLNLILKFRNKT